MLFCTQCGHQIDEKDNFCSACGQEIMDVQKPPEKKVEETVVHTPKSEQSKAVTGFPNQTPKKEDVVSAEKEDYPQRINSWVDVWKGLWEKNFKIPVFIALGAALLGLIAGELTLEEALIIAGVGGVFIGAIYGYARFLFYGVKNYAEETAASLKNRESKLQKWAYRILWAYAIIVLLMWIVL